jgi:regulator of sirC expression with transglutaminase-like and TPR domain
VAYLEQLDELARAAAQRLRGVSGERHRVERFNRFLFVEQRFTGNRAEYYDPRNSYLNEVLDRRSGIPITLSLVYTEVGRRAGLPVFGIAFPGHFLVKYLGSEELLIDAFHATLVTRQECEERLRALQGAAAQLDTRLLRPATPKEILVRMLRNLKHIYAQKGDWSRALQCCDGILTVLPETAEELRDRGMVYHRLECFAAALADFERYLDLAPRDAHADSIRELLPALRDAVAHLN